jgi:NhaA family Na+:H+ antiporter
VLVALLAAISVTVPILAIDSALPGGGMAEAARLGAVLTLGAAALALGLARLMR